MSVGLTAVSETTTVQETPQPFRVNVAEETLVDLRNRLAQTRWTDDFANARWQYGTNGSYLKDLIGYWLEEYDWRKHEEQINALPQFRVEIDGIPIHFVHVKGRGKRSIPLILSHGWPWTFWDLHKVIGPLADPAVFGGDPADAFDIVVPSLPGYGFSTPLRLTGISAFRTADLWVRLMQQVLGYKRFGAQGGDWGALIAAQLGHKYADRLLGLHIHLMVSLDALSGGTNGPMPSDYAPDEATWIQKNQDFFARESGYASLQFTKPQTPAFALNDSPAGLTAWILEKRRAWSDCGGDVESCFSKEELLTTVMIYWVTGSIGTSMRYYYETINDSWHPAHDRWPVVEAPTGIAIFPNEVILQPRRWAERYYNLKRWTKMLRGGHFAPMEQPEEMVEELRAFFRPLRS